MEWICLGLAMLCIAMSCVALWYREKWQKSDAKCSALERENRELSTGQRITISDNANMLANNINLQNALIALRGEVEQLRSQFPKRDSRGRYCKREEENYGY